jgi:hypothetical protein
MKNIFLERVASFAEQEELIEEEEVVEEVEKLMLDQAGCRLLQKKLTDAPGEVREKLVEALVPRLLRLVKDQFGNYLAQKVFEAASSEQRARILQTLKPHLVEVAQSLHGTRAVQSLVETLVSKRSFGELLGLFDALTEQETVELCLDAQANHVVQTLLSQLQSFQEGPYLLQATKCS